MRSRVKFVTQFLADLLEENYSEGYLEQGNYFQLKKKVEDRKLMLRLSRDLFSNPGVDVEMADFEPLRLVQLKSLTGTGYPFIVLPPRKKRPALRCFVGCRFAGGIPQLLKFNLRTILDAWNVQVSIAGTDLSASQLLGQIIREIQKADFCLFDNRGTLEKPNVYIEVGMAWVLKKPTIFCEYTGPRRTGLKTVPPTGALPADLRQLTRVQFRNDQELFRRIFFRFPRFVESNKLGRPA